MDIASKSHNNLAFQARSDKLIKGLGAFVKTPRNYPKGDVEVVLNSLGFKYNRANGSHYIYTNSSGDVFEFVGNGNTVDPKTVKQLQTLVKTVPKLKTM